MPLYEQLRWEEEQMESQVDFDAIHVDPAPFQLVENTNMMKVMQDISVQDEIDDILLHRWPVT